MPRRKNRRYPDLTGKAFKRSYPTLEEQYHRCEGAARRELEGNENTFAWQQRKFAAARLPSSREFIKAGAGSRLIPANPPKPCSINIAATQRFSLATELRSVEAGPTWNPRKLWRVESIFGRPKPITDTPTAALGSIAVANLMPALHHCELPHGEDLLKSRRQRDGGGGGGGGEGLRASLPRAKLGLRDLGPSGHPLSAFSCSSVSADALGFQDH
ncbi:hypothetical protein HZH66_011046 [Vespula vulgaris]|uniref:Uncharacterized protein n=1 Tax=Vespula vulgaris TaxID=7454 RepID=A0A834JGC1_VESVU|nr:hypothetical protein HZH66_011046 [Vespula vulgaris]